MLLFFFFFDELRGSAEIRKKKRKKKTPANFHFTCLRWAAESWDAEKHVFSCISAYAWRHSVQFVKVLCLLVTDNVLCTAQTAEKFN